MEAIEIFMKGIKEIPNKWKYIMYQWIRKLTLIENASILSKAIYRFNAIPIKIPMAFFMYIETAILKFACNHKRLQMPKVIMNNNNAEGIILPDFKV